MHENEDEDEHYMAAALDLARQGLYSTSPNPRVGCVLVKDGIEIGRGYHHRTGAPHAEIEALECAHSNTRGATVYVSLEPCNHTGRTPPCTEALIDAEVARVVYAVTDPNPSVSGGGAARLRAAGIDVVGEVGRSEAAVLNRGYLKRMRRGRPWVRVKIAMSIDGCAALESGASQWITGAAARADVQRLRAESCAIATGIGTVLADDPSLNVRDQHYTTLGRQPKRIVLDSRLRMPPSARMLSLEGETWVFHGEPTVVSNDALTRAGASIEAITTRDAHIDIECLLTRLAELEINELLVEAGPTLAGAFITGHHFDELVIYVAPKLLGATAKSAFDIASPLNLAEAQALDIVGSDLIGDDLRLVLKPKQADSDAEGPNVYGNR